MSLIPLTPLSAALTAATLARNLFLVQRTHFPGFLEMTGCCVDRQSRFQRGRDDWQGLSSGLAVIDRIRLRRDLGSWWFRGVEPGKGGVTVFCGAEFIARPGKDVAQGTCDGWLVVYGQDSEG
jgi:hypothetical protein